MTFNTLLNPRLAGVAEASLKYFKKHYGKMGLKINEEIDESISWRPTFHLKPKKSLIIATEVQDVLNPNILKIAYFDIIKYDFPISVYLITPLEVFLADHDQKLVGLLKKSGFGIVTVDLEGNVTIQFQCIPLSQHIAESEIDTELRGLNPTLKVRFTSAFTTFRSNEGQGLQESGQIVEAVIKALAKEASRKNLITNGVVNMTAAEIIDELYSLNDFKDHRAALGGAREFVKEFRNIASHPAKNGIQAISKIKICKNGFIESIRVTRQLHRIYKTKHWKLNLP